MQTSGEPDTRLESFRDVSMEFDAVYGMLAKSCGLSGTEYWALILIQAGVETQRAISDQLSLIRQTLTKAEQADLIRLTRQFSSALRQSLNRPNN